MSKIRDRRRRLGAFYKPDWRTPNYDAFFKKTMEAYEWPLYRMMTRHSAVSMLYDESMGLTRPRAPDELISDLQAWAKRES